ncbi:hypothetical protein DL96DRAFT_1595345 [Flagelloscypha sp. PMI_526]|nr:hypothetical protein DL96DRAFT_1595345 [Flagelloscypha sp. PMI_526]
MSTAPTLPVLPSELWAQVFTSLTALSDSYKELTTYLLICKLSYSCIAPRLYETLHISSKEYDNLQSWMQGHLETLQYAVKRVHVPCEFPSNVQPNVIAQMLDICKATERLACWVYDDFHEDHSIARAIASLPALRYLQINVLQLSFLLNKVPESPLWFNHITCLSIHFWDSDTLEPSLQAFKSVDLAQFESLTRLCLDTEDHPQLILSMVLSTALPPSLKFIVVFDDVAACEEIAAHCDDPRVFFYRKTGSSSSILKAALFNRERPKYSGVDSPLDDWGEITASVDQAMWLWVEEAKNQGKNVFERPVVDP